MKNKVAIKLSQSSSPGILMDHTTGNYAIDWTSLPASDHFFLATDYQLKHTPNELKFLFGSVSSFSENADQYDSAVEIHFPIREACIYFYRTVFIEKSGNSIEPFFNSVEKALNGTTYDRKKYKLPENKATSFRLFPANFTAMSFSGSQALLELFEVPPDLLHLIRKNKNSRPSSGVKPVMSIILNAEVLYSLLTEIRPLLKDICSKQDEVVNE